VFQKKAPQTKKNRVREGGETKALKGKKQEGGRSICSKSVTPKKGKGGRVTWTARGPLAEWGSGQDPRTRGEGFRKNKTPAHKIVGRKKKRGGEEHKNSGHNLRSRRESWCKGETPRNGRKKQVRGQPYNPKCTVYGSFAKMRKRKTRRGGSRPIEPSRKGHAPKTKRKLSG